MAGYYEVYYVGGQGGFMGVDGINPIFFEILVGASDRQYLVVHYHDTSIKPLGNLEVILPKSPNYKDMILDACIAFFPSYFYSCPSLELVKNEVIELQKLYFEDLEKVSPHWKQLRKEARPLYKKLHIYKAELKEL